MYCIDSGELLACLDVSIIDNEVVAIGQGTAKCTEELSSDLEKTVVFRDNAFVDDMATINITTILELNGISHVRSLLSGGIQ